MKQLRKVLNALDKELTAIHAVTLKDGTSGLAICWEVRIAVVDPNKKGKVIATTDDIVKVLRKK